MRFRIFNNGKQVTDFALHGAYLFGSDGMAIRKSQVSFVDGILECYKPSEETAGVALLWHAAG